MSDAAVEAARKFHEWMEERAYKWVSELVEKQVGEFVAIHTADLTARLASAMRTIDEFKATNRLLYGERDDLKAAVEQARRPQDEPAVRAAVENAVQLILVEPPGTSFQADADDWAAKSMNIDAFVETITRHVMAARTSAAGGHPAQNDT